MTPGQSSTIGEAEAGYVYGSGKSYSHSLGISACFRQHRATHSHCQYLHGYALQVDLEFEAFRLDERNWVQDFGGLKDVKDWIFNTFDHKTIVAKDDPQISIFRELHIAKMVDLVILDAVGCESFARIIFDRIRYHMGYHKLIRVTVNEHGANSAWYGVPR